MNKYRLALVSILIVVGVVVCFMVRSYQQSHISKAVEQPIATVTYRCDAHKSITALYYQGTPVAVAPGEAPIPTGRVELALSDGQQMMLAQSLSADGARYANTDESFVFWSKGDGALVLEHDKEQNYTHCIDSASTPVAVTHTYTSPLYHFSIQIPEGYTTDESYTYTLDPKKTIPGVKFTIPESLKQGTNLSSETYISVETLPHTASCTATLFINQAAEVQQITDQGVMYSVATVSDAGAGNRYEETVYAFPTAKACMAVRYFIHYGAIENYDPGVITAFDKQGLLALFDSIRHSLSSIE